MFLVESFPRGKGLKRYLELMVLGLVGLLMAAFPAVSPIYAAAPDAPGIQASIPQSTTAGRETTEGPAISACPLAPSLSRVDQPSLHGIVVQPPISVILEPHGLGTADFSAESAHESGFDQFRRAPPTLLLH